MIKRKKNGLQKGKLKVPVFLHFILIKYLTVIDTHAQFLESKFKRGKVLDDKKTIEFDIVVN